MPHLILEHSDNLPPDIDLDELLVDLHETLARQETINVIGIKSRAVRHDRWISGRGVDTAFVHVEVVIMAGRPLLIRRRIGEALRAVVWQAIREAAPIGLTWSVTVELREFLEESYFNADNHISH